MTDPGLADATYIEPITPEFVEKIIVRERDNVPAGRVFALLPTMGGQTALNTALSLRKRGVLEKYNIELIGACAAAIDKAEDRELFRQAMMKIGLDVPRGITLKGYLRHKKDGRRLSLRRREQSGDGAVAGSVRPCAAGARPGRPARRDPAFLHARRHRRRHRLQPRGVLRDRRARPGRLADQRSADRGIRSRLEGIRDGGRARQGRQRHRHLLHRERRPDGRAHRRFHHRGARADPDRQGISAHAHRLDHGAARDRRGDRRFQRPVRGQSGGRAHGHDRDEPTRVAFLGAGFQGDGISHRQGRSQAGRRLHARRTDERHHASDAGFVRTHDRLCRDENPALCVREISPARNRSCRPR